MQGLGSTILTNELVQINLGSLAASLLLAAYLALGLRELLFECSYQFGDCAVFAIFARAEKIRSLWP